MKVSRVPISVQSSDTQTKIQIAWACQLSLPHLESSGLSSFVSPCVYNDMAVLFRKESLSYSYAMIWDHAALLIDKTTAFEEHIRVKTSAKENYKRFAPIITFINRNFKERTWQRIRLCSDNCVSSSSDSFHDISIIIPKTEDHQGVGLIYHQVGIDTVYRKLPLSSDRLYSKSYSNGSTLRTRLSDASALERHVLLYSERIKYIIR
nr:hypothetical protein Iba_chr01dCG13920 [Ipomoea batatas]